MNNLSLRAKLLGISGFLITITFVIGFVFHIALGNVIKDYKQIIEVAHVNSESVDGMNNNVTFARMHSLRLVSSRSSSELKAESFNYIKGTLEEDKKLHARYTSFPFLPGEEILYNAYRAHMGRLIAIFSEVVKKYEAGGDTDENLNSLAQLVFSEVSKEMLAGEKATKELQDFHKDYVDHSMQSAADTEFNASVYVPVIGLIVMAIGFFASLLFSNKLVGSLTHLAHTLDDSTGQLSSAAVQIASSSEELSQSATEQASSLEETSASVEEMSSMIAISAENARKAAEVCESSQNEANRGRVVVTEMAKMMGLINESNDKIMTQMNITGKQMGEIVGVIKEIEQKTKIINDIVFQTKLLSFNASVEAARAGEQGKGFAVVAEEVGNLAAMSGKAATEISNMLSMSVVKVEQIVKESTANVDNLVHDGQEKIKKGVQVVKECEVVLNVIATSVSEVTRMSQEISTASSEQSKGIQEITKAMGQLDQVTQSNSAASEQTSSAADQLSGQATSLKGQVAELVSVIKGMGKTSTTVATTEKVKTKRVEKKKERKPENVIDFKNKVTVAKATLKSDVKIESKKVANSQAKDAVPNHDHPGFEDV